MDEADRSAPGAGFFRGVLRRLHDRRMRLAALRSVRDVAGDEDGRLRLRFDDGASSFERAAAWREDEAGRAAPEGRPAAEPTVVPRLSIVVHVLGSRGDVQPFLAIGERLVRHHRVRLATHAAFRDVVERAGLEFFPLAGDPRELVDYMVRTGGSIVPTRLDMLVEDVPRKRRMIAEVLASTWRACTEPDPGRPGAAPFRADLIVANPVSWGHIHCAEALDVPLHLAFTMPWTPTHAFPHPLTHLDPGADHPVRNYLSYAVANTLMWIGVADLVNAFRERTLGLSPVGLRDGPTLLDDAEVPFTYLFPESVVPRPPEWGPWIDCAGFVFRDRPAGWEPPADLGAFLAAGEPPVYVGFGSMTVRDAPRLTRVVFDAIAAAGVRAVVARGWAELGGAAPPPGVHVVDAVPHDWLFPRCRAACHHGGAGTTAASLRAGLPTAVVPFFGDQFFWARTVADAGAGPPPVPLRELSVDGLAAALRACADPALRARADALGAKVRAEDGVAGTLDAIRRHLPLRAMQCANDPRHLATTWCETCRHRLCVPCGDARHRAHRTFPYGWVDWRARPSLGPLDRLRGLVAEAAGVLGAGEDELAPRAVPRRTGVVRLAPGAAGARVDEADGDAPDDDGPVYRRAGVVGA